MAFFNVICSDKTGTLTTNQMAVTMVSIFTKERSFGMAGPVDADDSDAHMKKATHQLRLISFLCNRATFEDPSDSTTPIHLRKVIGDATDSALLRYAACTINIQKERGPYHLLHYIPFNSKTKFMASIYEFTSGSTEEDLFSCGEDGTIIMVKGAPECMLTSTPLISHLPSPIAYFFLHSLLPLIS